MLKKGGSRPLAACLLVAVTRTDCQLAAPCLLTKLEPFGSDGLSILFIEKADRFLFKRSGKLIAPHLMNVLKYSNV